MGRFWSLLIVVVVFLCVVWGFGALRGGVWYGRWSSLADSVQRGEQATQVWAVDSTRWGGKRDSTARRYRVLHVELNGADSLQLVKVYGIGGVFAHRILEYRARLGGFCKVEQLKEVRGITEDVFERVGKNFWVDSAEIQKIDVNFAARTVLETHPYITKNMARRILKGRQTKGGYTNTEQLVQDDILLPQEAEKLAPYFSFVTN